MYSAAPNFIVSTAERRLAYDVITSTIAGTRNEISSGRAGKAEVGNHEGNRRSFCRASSTDPASVTSMRLREEA